jgi:hypothetical protein
MKLHEVDWSEVLAWLPRWEALPPAARQAFIEIKPGSGAEPAALRGAADALVEAGLLVPPGPSGRLYAAEPGARPLLFTLRAMHRLAPLAPGRGADAACVQEMLSPDQVRAMLRMPTWDSWFALRSLVEQVNDVEWVSGFLKGAARAARWEERLLTQGERPRLVFPRVAAALRELVPALLARGGRAPLRDLPALLPEATPGDAAAALAAGLRYLLVFVSLATPDQDPLVGLLPAVVRRLGPPPPPPVAFAPAETFEAAYRVADMTAVLVEACAEPLRLKTNGELYARTERAVAERMVRVPRWAHLFLAGGGDPNVGHGDGDGEGEEEPRQDRGETGIELPVRIYEAIEELRTFGFVHEKKPEGRPALTVTKAGRDWLAGSDRERLKGVLDAIRRWRGRNPRPYDEKAEPGDFFGLRLRFKLEPGEPDLRAAVTGAFLSIPAEGVVPLEEFIGYHAEVANPFLRPEAEDLRGRVRVHGVRAGRSGWEEMWAAILVEFLRGRLMPLGGARAGRAGSSLGFALTDTGRYLLGATDEMPDEKPGAGAEVVVQPDFSVVFLAAAPGLEAELTRFAERTGSGVGALFRITRASVMRAAEQGLSADAVLKTLGGVSRTPVPSNVARQVRDWFGATRRVRVRPTVLLECPDTETATRVAALAGPAATAVTRTILRLEGGSTAMAELTRKLRAKGIFVHD